MIYSMVPFPVTLSNLDFKVTGLSSRHIVCLADARSVSDSKVLVTKHQEVRGFESRCYSTVGPVSAWMGDRLSTSKLSRYVTVTMQPHRSTKPGNSNVGRQNEWYLLRQSGVALVIRTYGLNALRQGDEQF